jgi:hypothetical protein
MWRNCIMAMWHQWRVAIMRNGNVAHQPVNGVYWRNAMWQCGDMAHVAVMNGEMWHVACGGVATWHMWHVPWGGM